VVVEIAGKKIKDSHDLLYVIAGFQGRRDRTDQDPPGRPGAGTAITPSPSARSNAEIAEAIDEGEAFGMVVQEITPEIARQLGLSQKKGIIVVEVQEGSIADEVGLQPQDIILQVNKAKVATLREYAQEVRKALEKGGILLLVKRGKSTFFVPLGK
jgi:serine protease Do